jgi:hypothetical protein
VTTSLSRKKKYDEEFVCVQESETSLDSVLGDFGVLFMAIL